MKSQEEKYLELSEYERKVFDFSCNCGGWALNIDGCVFPERNSMAEAIDNLLLLFGDFVRIGETPHKDEYFVLFRKEKDKGHHFIKKYGESYSHKNGCESVKIENCPNWGNLQFSEEVFLCVKYNHREIKGSYNI